MEQLIGADWRDLIGTADVAFLLAFPSLFSIINPIGGALIFYGVTKDFSLEDKEKVAALVGVLLPADHVRRAMGRRLCAALLRGLDRRVADRRRDRRRA